MARRALTIGIVMAAVVLGACGTRPAAEPSASGPTPAPPPPPPARAYRITSADQLIAGPAAAGTIGDYKLENHRVELIISDAPIAYGFSETGGNLMDAAPRGGHDALSQLYLYLDDTFPRQALNREVTITSESGDVAAITVTGVDSGDATLTTSTTYTLGRGDDTLRLSTTITNTSAKPVADYEIGDVISWGQAEHFAPGFGFLFRGRIVAPWLAGVGDDVSYGYAATAGDVGGVHGSAWSDTILKTVTLAPGEQVTIERYFVIAARGDAAWVAARLLDLRGERGAPVAGAVAEDQTGAVVPGARVTARRAADGAPVMVARTGEDGRFGMLLPPGDYRLDAAAPGRVPVGETTITAAHGASVETKLAVTRVSSLAFTVEETLADGSRAPSPAKLTLRGVAPTPDPELGPRYRAAGAGPVVMTATGSGTIALAPGSYRVWVSRGPEYSLDERTITVEAGKRLELAAVLTRVVDTTGYVSADFHQHQLPSPDSSVSLPDRVAANLGEGVEIAVATDHNQITDLAPALAELGATAPLRTVVGLEATTEQIGHFQVYPLTRREHESRGGAPLVDGKAPAEIFRLARTLAASVVVQVNHPRSGKSGYFDLAGFPADARAPLPAGLDLSFDALEVLNGKRVGDFEQVLRDWFQLLDRGLLVTATGGSDSHAIYGQECGYPRVYLGAGTDDPRAVTDAQILTIIKQTRDVVATNGPFFTLRANGASAIGQTFKKSVSVELVVQAAPWIDVTRIELYRSGKLYKTIPVPASTQVERARMTLNLTKPGYYVVVVRGDKGLDPVVPDDEGHPVTPIAVANPIWITAK